MSRLLLVALFFVLKYAAYLVYCYAGLAWLPKPPNPRWPGAHTFAFLGMSLGWCSGLLLGLVFHQSPHYSNLLGIPEWFGSWVATYVICFGFLRALQWG
jgi:hypothetical protein